MREVKFRAWAAYGEMLSNVQNHIGNGAWAFGNMLMKPDDFSIMQFTGLTDKNGVEIYEGDIVSMPYIDPMGKVTDDVDYLSDVNYENGCFCIFNSYQKVERMPIYSAIEKSVGKYIPNHGNLHVLGDFIGTVIGNIHQHPELLK